MTEVLSLGGFLITRDEWELWGEDDRRDILTALAGDAETENPTAPFSFPVPVPYSLLSRRVANRE